jgi:hypothetical protein
MVREAVDSRRSIWRGLVISRLNTALGLPDKGAVDAKFLANKKGSQPHACQPFIISPNYWSGREDLNLRPPEPHEG